VIQGSFFVLNETQGVASLSAEAVASLSAEAVASLAAEAVAAVAAGYIGNMEKGKCERASSLDEQAAPPVILFVLQFCLTRGNTSNYFMTHLNTFNFNFIFIIIIFLVI
jgi:hypothetical protein